MPMRCIGDIRGFLFARLFFADGFDSLIKDDENDTCHSNGDDHEPVHSAVT